MIFRRTTGVVLRCRDFSETSKIVIFYTRDFGKVRVVAKGAKRKKSEFLGILEPLSVLEIVYIERRGGLHILKEAHLMDSHLELRERVSRIAHGLQFLSLIESTQPEEDADPAVFELLLSSLFALHRARSPENVSIVLHLRLLKHFGRLPSLTNCSQCESPLKGTAYYDPRWGSLRCQGCGEGGSMRLPQGTLQVLRRLAEAPFDRCMSLRLLKEQREELTGLVGIMLKAATETELTAEEVVKSLLR